MKYFKKLQILAKKQIVNYTLLALIFFILCQEFNLFRNTYYLLTKSYNERLVSAYKNNIFSGFCKKSSIGYLIYLKNNYPKKFNNNQLPEIINNFNGRKNYWIFENVNAKINSKRKIILNFKNDVNLKNYKIIDNFQKKCLFVEKYD
tara:strand:+ start:212 stop:652 length:441 start_codon:yes stop_codon:yes gene_type:complete